MVIINISVKLKKLLDKMKTKKENYNDIIEKLVEDELELNKETIKELELSKKSKSYSHSEIKKRFNL